MGASHVQKASWTRDEHGIPQIAADDIAGLYWGMGYCHAMDRGMQLLIMRILGQGRAAELLDGSDAMVEVDRFFRRMNWGGGVAEEEKKLSPEARAARHPIKTFAQLVVLRRRQRLAVVADFKNQATCLPQVDRDCRIASAIAKGIHQQVAQHNRQRLCIGLNSNVRALLQLYLQTTLNR